MHLLERFYSHLLAALQNVQQFGSFRGKVFFRINPAVNGEPALRRHDVEVCAAALPPSSSMELRTCSDMILNLVVRCSTSRFSC